MYQISDDNQNTAWTLDVTLPGFTLPFAPGNHSEAANYIYLRRCLAAIETLEPQDYDVWTKATRDAIAECFSPQAWNDYLANPWEVYQVVRHLADGLDAGAKLFTNPPEFLRRQDMSGFLIEAQKMCDRSLLDALEVSSLPPHWSERLA